MRIGPLHHAAVLLVLLVAALSGCTHLKPLDVDPATLQENIRNGTAVQKGETVRIVTRNGVSHLLVVAGVDERVLRGYAAGAPPGSVVTEIPVDEVIALEREQVNPGESATGSIGASAIVFAVVFVIAPAAVLGALGVI